MHTHLHQYFSAIETLRRIEAIMKARDICATHVECAIATVPHKDDLGEDQVCRYIHSVNLKDFPLEICWILVHGEGEGSLDVKLELEFNESLDVRDHFALIIQHNSHSELWSAFVESLYDQTKEPGKPGADLSRFMDQWGLDIDSPKEIPAIHAWSLISKVGDLFAERLQTFRS